MIDLVNNVHKYFQSGLGMGFLHQFLDHRHPGKHYALASAGHMGEQAMLNGVVFGAVGRVMGDADFDADFIGQRLEVLFKEVVPSAVVPPPSHSTKMEVACR